jgi:hypothetical protein
LLALLANADGTSGGQVGSTGTVSSRWQMSGSTFTTIDVSGTPPRAACPPNEPGRYTVRFSPDCTTATLSVQGGPTPRSGRRLALESSARAALYKPICAAVAG